MDRHDENHDLDRYILRNIEGNFIIVCPEDDFIYKSENGKVEIILRKSNSYGISNSDVVIFSGPRININDEVYLKIRKILEERYLNDEYF